MSNVIAVPDFIAAAATDVATVASSVNAAHMAAAAPTVAVMPAAADEVSAGIASLFSKFGETYQATAGQVAAFPAQFAQNLTASAGSYVAAEAANIGSLLSGVGSSVGAAAAAVPAQVSDMLSTTWNTIVGSLTFVWNALNILGGLAYIVAYLNLLLAWLVLNLVLLLAQSEIGSMFGVLIPLALPI
ncbi:PE family protein [Mycobacterium parmense]|uniref:PE domain-containing protein n=1 Tax=Mycobacterium parmense TaxID=185642 RepID=A0A7I7YRL1_9MYCO|nr:PE family protein [Mycobacterium parmense]MCV7352017.1 PE family protein [Mycobacterium parmense]BBZ44508.1 hypothetical protein MPRM_17890 [Mycobacterium parmense]